MASPFLYRFRIHVSFFSRIQENFHQPTAPLASSGGEPSSVAACGETSVAASGAPAFAAPSPFAESFAGTLSRKKINCINQAGDQRKKNETTI